MSFMHLDTTNVALRRSFRRALRTIAVLALLGASAAPAAAQCKPGGGGPPFDGDWLNHYEGTINGTLRIRMTLSMRPDRVDGVYFYASQLKDIRVAGHVATDGKTIQLDELGPNGQPSARFEGEFAAKDPQGHFGSSPLTCEVIVGTWRAEGSSKALPVYLVSESSSGGTLAHQYEVAGVTDDEVVHRGARAFWDAVKRGDRQVVAALVAYPITIRLGERPVKIANAADFVVRYDEIFTPAFRDAVVKALPRNMFARDQGVMLGNGQVWFGPDGKVFAINP